MARKDSSAEGTLDAKTPGHLCTAGEAANLRLWGHTLSSNQDYFDELCDTGKVTLLTSVSSVA